MPDNGVSQEVSPCSGKTQAMSCSDESHKVIPYHANTHEVTITLTCEMYELLCEAAQITGCGEDLEKYIKRLILEHC